MATNQELRQASVRAATGTAYAYNDDWLALFDADGIAEGVFNDRMLLWINSKLSSSYTNINDAMRMFAIDQGFTSWDHMGTFDPGGGAPADTTPDAFTFTDITDATVSTVYTSNTITVSGINASTAITITGGTYAINGGSYVSTAGTVVNGDTVTVRHTSSGSASTATNTVLTIGGVSDTYTTTTAAAVAALDLPFSTWTSNSDLTTAGVTFSRASSATRVNSSGVIASAATDVARFAYNPIGLAARGLMVESARTNRVHHSATVITSPWTMAGLSTTANSATAPDGTTTATLFTETGVTNHLAFQLLDTTVTAGNVVTKSIYAKAGTRNFVYLSLEGGSQDWVVAVFNLSTAAVSQTAVGVTGTHIASSITDAGNGWYRCVLTGSLTTTNSYFVVGTAALASGNTFNANGQETHTGTSTCYFWGAQMETASSVSSLILTSAAAGTRAADAVSVTIPSGVTTIRHTYSDATTSDVSVTPSATYNFPTSALPYFLTQSL